MKSIGKASTSKKLSELPRLLMSGLSAGRRLVWRRPAEIISCCLLLMMGANLLSVAVRKTITNDEIIHLPAGYLYLVSGNFRLNPEHPPLVKMWAAAPLLLIHPKLDPSPTETSANFEKLTLSSSVKFWKDNRERFEWISFWMRLPMVVLTISLGGVIFICGRQLFGARAATLAVLLFSLEPTMLAHGRVVHTDIPAALGLLVFLAGLGAYCSAPSFRRAVLLGIAMGVALLAKFSMVIVVPIFFSAAGYVLWRSPKLPASRQTILLQFCVAFLLAIFLINVAYGFQHPTLEQSDVQWIAGKPLVFGTGGLQAIAVLSKILPTYYVFGLYSVVVHNSVGHPAYLLGQHSASGWWYYFPVVFALKTTIPFLLLSLFAVCWAFWRGIVKREKALVAVVIPIVLYTAISMMGQINIGIRHLAPIFPFLFLLGGAGLDRLLETKLLAKGGIVITVVLLGSMLVEGLRSYPDYMSYLSPLALGKPGWQLLSDSNVEWGDDVGDLARYLRARGETKVGAALSGGWVTLELYGIQYLDLFAARDGKVADTKYIAIGAGLLNGSTVPAGLTSENGTLNEEQRQMFFARYRGLAPEAVFGKAIYLYRVKD